MTPDSESFESAIPVNVVHAEPPEDGVSAEVIDITSERGPRTAGGNNGTGGRVMPASEDAETHVIACCLLDGEDTSDKGILGRAIHEGLKPESFFWPANATLFGRMLAMRQAGLPLTLEVLAQELKANKELEVVGGFPYLMQVTSGVPTIAHAGYMIAMVKEKADRRQLIRDLTGTVEQSYNGVELPELLQTAKARIEAIQTGSTVVKQAEAVKALEQRRVAFTAKPKEPVTRLFLAGKPVCTPGNLTTLISKAKTGKTASLGGAVAAVIAAMTGKTDLDSLGFSASNPNGQAVIHIDTEQSLYDAWLCYERALKRAETESDPKWLMHYALVGYAVQQLKEALTLACQEAAKKHKGIFLIILDGVADFVLSVNDEAESKTMVTFLRSLAVEYDCPIIAVIHSNEAVKAGDDGRGHLGKELTRKAESNLLLRKNGEVTVITSEKQRKAPITEDDGVAFKWSDAEGRHVSCQTVEDAKLQAKREKAYDMAEDVFESLGKPTARYAELVKAIGDVFKVGPSRAEDRFNEMKKLGVISKDIVGSWSLAK